MSRIAKLIRTQEERLVRDWMREQSTRASKSGVARDSELRSQAQELVRLLADALDHGDGVAHSDSPAFAPLREMLSSLSRTRSQQGFSPSETVHFVLSVKKPLLALASEEGGDKGA